MQGPQAKPTLDIRREVKQCGSCGQRFSPDATFCPFDGAKLEPADFDPLRDPLLGTLVDGRYEVVALLGEGGMGQVYEVRHVSLDRRFAMKVLRRDLARDEELAGRFIDEAKATASIHHPSVVQITDFGLLPDGTPYFIMELLVGRTLGQVIKAGGPIPAARAVRILDQVAGALAAAHAAGVVHRDLKPENVFLVGGMAGGRASDDVRVVDFGAAKIVGSSRVTQQGIVYGTPHYMSPEQAGGQTVDHRSDVYALGVIMYEMFTGRVPFEADTYMGVLTQHMFVQPTPPSEVSPAARELGALEAITMTCLAKKPEERFASMTDLAAALASAALLHSDGRIDIAPHVGGIPKAAARPRYPMADELEPPTFAELRRATDPGPAPRTPAWRWLALAGGILGVGTTAAWVLSARVPSASPPRPEAPSAPMQVAVPPAPSPSVPAPVTSVTAPPAVSVSPVAAASSGPGAAVPPASVRRAPTRPPRAMDDVGDPFAQPR